MFLNVCERNDALCQEFLYVNENIIINKSVSYSELEEIHFNLVEIIADFSI